MLPSLFDTYFLYIFVSKKYAIDYNLNNAVNYHYGNFPPREINYSILI